jgi:hypothetical protein
MPTDNVVDIRDRLGATPPNVVWVTPEDVFDLARLRQLEAAVLPALKKVAKHRQLGYDHIKVGAFDAALEALGLNETKETT